MTSRRINCVSSCTVSSSRTKIRYRRTSFHDHPLVGFSSFSSSSSSSSSLLSPTTKSSFNNDDTSNPKAETTTTSGGPSAVRSQKPYPTTETELQMLSFYHFAKIQEPISAVRDSLFDSINTIPGLRGTIYLATEGINGQLAVPPFYLEDLLTACQQQVVFESPLVVLFQDENENPPNLGDIIPIDTPTFNRLIVRTRDYVLRDGIPPKIRKDLNWSDAGIELSPKQWHEALIRQQPSDDNDNSPAAQPPIILDCRNDYESVEGTFDNAIPLNTRTFQDSWDVLDDITKDVPSDRPIQIFCTGGIRCVKVGAYLKQNLGFENVQRLQHGIIGYQQWYSKNHAGSSEREQPNQPLHNDHSDDDNSETDNSPPSSSSAWKGENFLFDKRRFADKENEETNST